MSTAPTWPGLLARLLEGEDLSIFEASWAMRRVMEGEATPAGVQNMIDALVATKQIPQAIPLQQILDVSYLEKVRRGG